MSTTKVIRDIERKHANMGMSASQARLLTITSRLTSNEYESQQITNAKMRLATQSQEASEAYISALNTSQYSFVTYDSQGNSNNTPLTAAVLYEYGDNKNQYIITNSAGKALVSNADAQNYQNSRNLNEFLSKYGIEQEFQTDTLKNTYNKCMKTNTEDPNGLLQYKTTWDSIIKTTKGSHDASEWKNTKLNVQQKYLEALNKYTLLNNQKDNGVDVSNDELTAAQNEMETYKANFTSNVSYESFIENIAVSANPTDYENYQKYNTAKAEYEDELDRLGLSAGNAYQYKDKTKAQWYTNLWYKMNGASTDKSGAENYAVLNPAKAGDISSANSELSAVRNLATMESSTWIADALAKGYINLEMASYSGDAKTLQDDNDPFKFNLQGISWKSKIYSSCADIVSTDNNKAAAQAEAEYERKTAEINAKDEKYQRKLSLLESEHTAIEKEYDSVKSAMEKNIDRSFKAFQG